MFKLWPTLLGGEGGSHRLCGRLAMQASVTPEDRAPALWYHTLSSPLPPPARFEVCLDKRAVN